MKTLQSPSLNGRVQKTLSHQLDRLDEILDGFAEALQAAVGEAVAAAVGAAVRDAVAVAVREALAVQAQMQLNAQIHAQTIAASQQQPLPLPEAEVEYEVPVAVPSRWSRLRSGIAAAGRSICAKVSGALAPRARTVAGRVAGGAAVTVAVAKAGVALVRGDRRAGRWAALAGVVAGLAFGFGDPAIAALVGGAAVAIITAAALMTAPLWRPLLSAMGKSAAR